MTYPESLEFLFGELAVYQLSGQKAYKPGLERMLELSERMGHPQRSYRVIHVAGTNGKGSVAHMLAAVLQAAGLKVGLHTSPHLTDFRERARVNGQMVAPERVAEFVGAHHAWARERRPSFFELSLGLALWHFQQEGVDWAVIETGLGGRLDATNIVEPEACAITTIGWDHMDLLGDTLEQIAAEKAGIIKPGVPVAVGDLPAGPMDVVRAAAQRQGAPLLEAARAIELEAVEQGFEGQRFRWRRPQGELELDLDLAGHYQIANLRVVLATLELLRQHRGLALSDEHLRDGLARAAASTGLRGRWQIVRRRPTVIFDTAHNAEGFEAAARQLALLPRDRRLRIILGLTQGKEIDKILGLLPARAGLVVTQASNPRSVPALELEAAAERLVRHCLSTEKPWRALSFLMAQSTSADIIFVGGSNFLVADLLAMLDDPDCPELPEPWDP